MSFLDDLDDFFISGDTFYPDNKKRRSRVKSLEEDCNQFISLCKEAALTGNELMKQLEDKVKGMSIAGENLPKELQVSVPHQREDSPYESMLNIYCNLSGNPVILLSWRLTYAILHKQSIEEFAKELGIIAGLSVTMYAESLIFCGLPVAILTPGVVNGARNRSALQKGIKNGVKSRRELYKTYCVNKKLNEHITAVSLSLDAFIKNNLPLKDVVEHIRDKIAEFEKHLSDSLDSEVENDLEKRDSSLGRWTKEG